VLSTTHDRSANELSSNFFPERRNLKALIDTGASVNCIDNRAAKKLNLPVIDYKIFQSASGRAPTPIYLGKIEIPDLNTIILGQFYGAELGNNNESYQCLLGRPFLAGFIFSYNGAEGTFHLARSKTVLASSEFDE